MKKTKLILLTMVTAFMLNGCGDNTKSMECLSHDLALSESTNKMVLNSLDGMRIMKNKSDVDFFRDTCISQAKKGITVNEHMLKEHSKEIKKLGDGNGVIAIEENIYNLKDIKHLLEKKVR